MNAKDFRFFKISQGNRLPVIILVPKERADEFLAVINNVSYSIEEVEGTNEMLMNANVHLF